MAFGSRQEFLLKLNQLFPSNSIACKNPVIIRSSPKIRHYIITCDILNVGTTEKIKYTKILNSIGLGR